LHADKGGGVYVRRIVEQPSFSISIVFQNLKLRKKMKLDGFYEGLKGNKPCRLLKIFRFDMAWLN
jgi:hypothetical protein